ncbi:MAG: toxin TcdB middle/C-terminal domain-containing protein, partial [Bacteroidota bacterium]
SEAIQALHGDEYREAFRACKGMMLRQEIFALDAKEGDEASLKKQYKPYTVATHNCNIQQLQARNDNQYAVFLVTESEAINIHYERDETDYRIQHTLNTKIDELGNILESAAIVYGRNEEKAAADFQALSQNVSDFSEDVLNNDATQKVQLQSAFEQNMAAAKAAQTQTHIIYTQNTFAHYSNEQQDIDLPHAYQLRLPYEVKTYEITGLQANDRLFQLAELENILQEATPIPYHTAATAGLESRLIEQVSTRYLDNQLEPLDFGFFDSIGLPYENYQLAFTPDLIEQLYSKEGNLLEVEEQNVHQLIAANSKYSEPYQDGNLWIRSGITHFKEGSENLSDIQARFYVPIAFEDPFGAITRVRYDAESFSNTQRNNDGYYLYIQSTEDAIQNKMQIDHFNYRVLAPTRMIDLNANPSSVLLDELGMPKAMAVEGNGVFSNEERTVVNVITPADHLAELKEYSTPEEEQLIQQLLQTASYDYTDTSSLNQKAKALLQAASIRFIYDFHTYQQTGDQPTLVASIAREQHHADNIDSSVQFSFEYSDGLGNVTMNKVQAESGLAYYIENGQRKQKDTGTDIRWVGNGRTVLNNKGNPVKQYEPYFSTDFRYESSPELVEVGVTPILYYDALGRLDKTIFPDGSLTKVAFDAWKQIDYDQNDTLLDEECLWYQRRTDASRTDYINDSKEQSAALKALPHANTPTCVCLDALGRPVLSIANNGKDANNQERLYTTFIKLDIEGNAKAVIDSRGNTVMAYQYDLLGHRVFQDSMDAGKRWVLNNAMGSPIHRWDSRQHSFSFTYDAIQRPLSIKVMGGEATAMDHIYEQIVYGEGQSNEYEHNLRGQVIQQYDTAGIIQNLRFDFKGNLLESTRQFNKNYKDIPDWTSANMNTTDVEAELYSTKNEYDALNRVTKSITPDGSISAPTYNAAGLLEQIEVSQTDIASQHFVKNIDYDAKGQREKIVYGDPNGNPLATTKYEYDENTFRLIHLKTTKSNGELLQDLYYTYDPIGNITAIEDKAIPKQFFNNQKIEGKADYTYDALYRLTEAKGREHAGQAIDFGQTDNWHDRNFKKSYQAGDDMAWRNYDQQYV